MGSPHPFPMSEEQLNKTISSLNDEFPDLVEYAKSKGYRFVDGSRIIVDESVEKEEQPAPKVKDVEMPEDASVSEKELSPEEEKEVHKARIYSELNIKEDLDSAFSSEKPKSSPATGAAFSVNDFVFIRHLGFKGVIQEIDYEQDKVIVGVQMFGRRQPVECKIKDIQLI